MDIISSFSSRTQVTKHLLKDFKLFADCGPSSASSPSLTSSVSSKNDSLGTVIYVGTKFEDLYGYLKELPNAISCSVGSKASEASFFLDSPALVDQLLQAALDALQDSP